MEVKRCTISLKKIPDNPGFFSFTMKHSIARRIGLFLLKSFGFYFIWYLLYQFILNPWQKLDLFIIDITYKSSKWILELLGYVVFTGGDRLIGIDGTSGLWMGDNCNGLSLFALFAVFIIAFPGPIKTKSWYIPTGILLIQLINILRVVGLAIIEVYSYSLTELNHTYTFTLIGYSTIFLLWMLWVKKYSMK